MLRVQKPPPVDACPPDSVGAPIIHDCPDQHGRVWLRAGYCGRVACLASSTAACGAAPDFLQEIDGTLHLLLRSARPAALRTRWSGLLRELRSPAHLVARDGHQLQARVRRLVAKDRIYPIWLDTS